MSILDDEHRKAYYLSLVAARKEVQRIALHLSLAIVERRHHPKGLAGERIISLRYKLHRARKRRDEWQEMATPKEWKILEYQIQKGKL